MNHFEPGDLVFIGAGWSGKVRGTFTLLGIYIEHAAVRGRGWVWCAGKEHVVFHDMLKKCHE